MIEELERERIASLGGQATHVLCTVLLAAAVVCSGDDGHRR